jgi:Tfp pilus assembly protein PilN
VRSWLPESLLFASDARPIEVIRTSDGWLVRRWLEDRLAAELFYPAIPGAAEWSSTMATLGVSDADSRTGWLLLAEAQPAAPLPKPWPDRVERLDARAPVRTFDLRRLMLAGGGALVIATLVLGVISIRQWYVEGLLEQSLGEAKERLAPVAEQRSLAFDAAQRLQAWNELDRFPAPLELIDAFAESVPAGVVVSELRLDAGVIRATLSNPGIQPAAELVSKLQKSGRFTNIRVVPAADPRSLQVEMEVSRRAAPKANHGT